MYKMWQKKLYLQKINYSYREDLAFLGTLPSALRASDNPRAIACLRLFTVLCDLPDFNSPLFISCIALFTIQPFSTPECSGLYDTIHIFSVPDNTVENKRFF